MIKEKLSYHLTHLRCGRLDFSLETDGTKVAQESQVSRKYGAIIGGSYANNVISID